MTFKALLILSLVLFPRSEERMAGGIGAGGRERSCNWPPLPPPLSVLATLDGVAETPPRDDFSLTAPTSSTKLSDDEEEVEPSSRRIGVCFSLLHAFLYLMLFHS